MTTTHFGKSVSSFIGYISNSLAKGGSETEIYVSSLTTLTGETISTADFAALGIGELTIDPLSSTTIEFCTFTGVGTLSFTGVTRGLSAFGDVTATARKPYHPIGTLCIISFGAQSLNQLVDIVSTQTIDGVKTFSSSPVVPTSGTGTQAANHDDIAAAITGASGTATNSTFGTVKLSVAAVSVPNPIAVGDNDTRVPTQNENNALVGTSGTAVSASNKLVDNADTSGTGNVVRKSLLFGGDGSDGDLTVTTTTTLDLSSKTVYQYNNLTINNGATLTFSNGTDGTKVPVILVKGNFANNGGTITTVGKGIIGGNGGAGSDSYGFDGADGTQLFLDLTVPGKGLRGNAGGAVGGAGGAESTKNATYFYPFNLNGASAGGGGGGGSMNTGTGGAGGAGGAGSLGLYMEVLGNFVNSGTITLNGANGANGVNASGNGSNNWLPGAGGGGGGGGSGSLILKYKGTYTNSGSILVAGGTKGTGGSSGGGGGAGGSPSGNGQGGGGGSGGATYVNNGVLGGNGTTLSHPGGKTGGDGGDGGAGIKYLQKIQNIII